MNLLSLRSVVTFIFCLVLLTLPWLIGGKLSGASTGVLAFLVVALGVCTFNHSWIGSSTRLAVTIQLILLAAVGYCATQLIPGNGLNPSEYPAATKAQLASLILAIGTFFLSNCLFSDRQSVLWLFAAISINGVMLTFFSLAQIVSGQQLYWQYNLIQGSEMFGPYVNGNNGGGYLLMCFAAANFFLAIYTFRSLKTQQDNHLLDPSLTKKLIHLIGHGIAKAGASQLYVVAGLAITAAGVFASLSRGAIVALVVSLVVGWGLLFRRNLAFGFAALVVTALGMGLLSWTQRNEAVAVSIETLSELENTENKVAHWQDGFNYAIDYLPVGSGLGTYNLVYLEYQERPFVQWFKYAENQYLQTLAEVGIPGILMLLLLIGLTAYGCMCLYAKPDATSKALGLTGIMALLSQAIAGAFDFGLYLPANMCLLAAIVGAVFGQLNWCWDASNVAAKKPTRRILITRMCLGLLTLISVWATIEMSAVESRDAVRRFYLNFDPDTDRESIPIYRRLAEHAVKFRADDAQAHYQLALNHILDYRLAATETMLKEYRQGLDELREQIKTEENPKVLAEAKAILSQPELTFEDAWPRSKLAFLHRLSRETNYMSAELFEDLRNSVPVKNHLEPAWHELQLAGQACDKFWNIPLALGQLTLLMSPKETSLEKINQVEADHVAHAIQRSRSNTDVLFLAGVLCHHSDKTELACEYWNQCLANTNEFEQGIVQICLNEVSIKDFFERVLPNDPYYQLRIAKRYLSAPGQKMVLQFLLDFTKRGLSESQLTDAEKDYVLGEIERLSKNYPIAIVYFKKALEKENRVEWRLRLSLAMIEAKMFSSAITELKICQLYPGKHHLVCQKLLNRAKRGQAKAVSNRHQKENDQ